VEVVQVQLHVAQGWAVPPAGASLTQHQQAAFVCGDEEQPAVQTQAVEIRGKTKI